MPNSTQTTKNTAIAQAQSEQQSIDPGEAFEMLSNRRRRLTIKALDQQREWTLSNLAEHVAAAENDCRPAALDSPERKRVYVSLYQTHLDTLAAAGVLEVEDDRIAANEDVVATYCRILACARDEVTDSDDDEQSGMLASVLGGVRR